MLGSENRLGGFGRRLYGSAECGHSPAYHSRKRRFDSGRIQIRSGKRSGWVSALRSMTVRCLLTPLVSPWKPPARPCESASLHHDYNERGNCYDHLENLGG